VVMVMVMDWTIISAQKRERRSSEMCRMDT
jgi:hypothetical protein